MRVLVTGGGSGIGAAIADTLEGAGHTVIVCGRRPIERPGAMVWDVTKDPEGLIAQAGPLDALVNNAGHALHVPVTGWTEAVWMDLYRVHVVAPALLSRAFAAQASEGAIVNVCSTLAVRTAPGTGPYSAAKAALLSQTRTLAMELAPAIRVNAVLPGGVDTAMVSDRREALGALHPLGLGRPEDIAQAVLYLLTARWTTGTALTVDGGLTAEG